LDANIGQGSSQALEGEEHMLDPTEQARWFQEDETKVEDATQKSEAQNHEVGRGI
jgi:hypothetical protein